MFFMIARIVTRQLRQGIQNNDDGIEVSFAIVAINASQEVISCGSFCFYSFSTPHTLCAHRKF